MQPDFVIKRCSSKARLEKLFEELKKANTKGAVIQVFDPKRVISRMHLIGAYLDAVQAFVGGANIASSTAVEMLLFASMGRQISRAMEDIGAKSDKDFILFANSRESYSGIAKLIEKEEDFNPGLEEQEKTAEHYGIFQKEELDKFVLQRMAVSRIEE